jgi:cysteine synthase A
MELLSFLDMVGHTPTVNICMHGFDMIKLRAKLESCNPTGSVKDRAADYLTRNLLKTGVINQETTIIESSSGNFGVALAAYCKRSNLKFICVADPNISPANEMLIKLYGAEIISVTEPDENGGYLINRIKKVKEIVRQTDNIYWINQYENLLNAEAYYSSIGQEICAENENPDYIFIGVSSGGTITGISKKVKEKFPGIRVIGVDIYGSVIFGNPPHKRNISGIGSSIVPKILEHAKIDEVVIVDEVTSADMCRELLHDYSLFVGGSSGAVYAAIKKYFSNNIPDHPVNVLAIFPDSGWKYLNTIYNDNWSCLTVNNQVNLNIPEDVVFNALDLK